MPSSVADELAELRKRNVAKQLSENLAGAQGLSTPEAEEAAIKAAKERERVGHYSKEAEEILHAGAKDAILTIPEVPPAPQARKEEEEEVTTEATTPATPSTAETSKPDPPSLVSEEEEASASASAARVAEKLAEAEAEAESEAKEEEEEEEEEDWSPAGWEEKAETVEVRPGRKLYTKRVDIFPPAPPKPAEPEPVEAPADDTDVAADATAAPVKARILAHGIMGDEPHHQPNLIQTVFKPVHGFIFSLSSHGKEKGRSKDDVTGAAEAEEPKESIPEETGGDEEEPAEESAAAADAEPSAEEEQQRKKAEAQARVDKVTEPSPAAVEPAESPKKEEQEPDVPIVAEVVFVHGAQGHCGQFDELLDAIHGRLRSSADDDDEEAAESKEGGGGTNGTSNGEAAKRGSMIAFDTIRGLDILGGGVRCRLFDARGCGQSFSTADKDWKGYDAEELLKDLEAIVDMEEEDSNDDEETDEKGADTVVSELSGGPEEDVPLFIVAHSYGTSQAIQLACRRREPAPLKSPRRREIAGLVLLSGSLAGGKSADSCGPAADGGHCLFRLPTWMLRLFKPKMDKAFLDLAYPPEEDAAGKKGGGDGGGGGEKRAELRSSLATHCAANDLGTSRAFYRQTRWATSEEAESLRGVHALVVHGTDDRILHPSDGEELYEALPDAELVKLEGAGHFVMEERAEDVAGAVLKFVAEVLEERR